MNLVRRLEVLVGLDCPDDETSCGRGKSAQTSQGILTIKTTFVKHIPNRLLPEAKDKTRAGRPSQSLLDRGKVEKYAVLATRLRLCADVPSS